MDAAFPGPSFDLQTSTKEPLFGEFMNVRSLLCFLGLILVVPAATAAQSDVYKRNWPEWRGPDRNGIAVDRNPPLEWSENKNVKWKVAIPGRGHATPIIWENKVFVLTAVPTGQPAAQSNEPARLQASQNDERRPGEGGPRGRRGGFGGRGGPVQEHAFTVLCLDRNTGKVLWEKVARKETPHQSVQPSNSFSSGSPVTDGEHLYVSFGSQGLYCYDMNGNLVWEKDLGKVNVTFGEGSSPALAGNILLVLQDNNADSYLYALDKKTGREIWKKRRDEGSGWTTPFVLEHGGKNQVIVNGSRAVRSYNLSDGELLWECSGLGSNPVPMIVADQNAVYAMSGHREPAAMAIKLGRTGNLTGTEAVLWKIDRGTPYVPSPLLYNGLLFFCQRTEAMVTCLDPATGKPHYMQERLNGVSGVYASPVGVNNRIYLPGQNGLTVVLENSPELKIVAQNKLDDGFDASPAMVGKELFLRGRTHLYCITEQN